METQRITWTLGDRRVELRGDGVLAIGLELKYPERECGLSIRLLQPADGKQPEREFALAELRRLHEALTHILAAG